MNVFVKLAGDLPAMEKSFFRNIVAFLFASIILWKQKEKFRIEKGNLKFLLLRSAFGTVGILCNFYSVDHLVLADASMLNKMSPFFAIIGSYFILKERVSFTQGAAVVLAFVGSIFIIKPSFTNFDSLPAIIGLLGGLFAGIAYTYVRLLGTRGQNGPFIVFFFSGFSCLILLPVLIFDYRPMTIIQLIYLLGAGLAASGGQFAITTAYHHAPARELSVYDYSQIIFSAILGFFLFAQLPDLYSWIGYGTICMIAIMMYLKKE